MKYRQIGEYELTLSSTLSWLHDDPLITIGVNF